jgi:purine-binding chemotaxis protein CheW
LLRGAFRAQSHQGSAKILDIQALLAAAFTQRARSKRATSIAGGRGPIQPPDDGSQLQQLLVTFEVAGREYALSADMVREIVSAPDTIAQFPRAEALVLGVIAFRETLLPLLSLRGLLGFDPAEVTDGREKIIVTAVAGVLVGLVTDRMRAIVRADPQLIDPTPSILVARMGGETTIKAIYRGDGGRRLISILAPAQLFREDVMRRLGDPGHVAPSPGAGAENIQGTNAQFLVFRLGGEEYGLPIGSVDEVERVPEQITRIPKTPKFLEGVINLRGEVLPVVDQRRRFDLPKFMGERERQRLIVVRTDRHRAALIVDSVSEVLLAASDAVEPAPDLANEKTRLVHGVINLEATGRMVLLLDPAELLSRSERSLLDAFNAAVARAPS